MLSAGSFGSFGFCKKTISRELGGEKIKLTQGLPPAVSAWGKEVGYVIGKSGLPVVKFVRVQLWVGPGDVAEILIFFQDYG